MDIERRFVFRGSATPAGGRISRPKELVIESGGASSLTVTGGRSRGEIGRIRFGEFASLRSAATLAEGLFDDRVQAREMTLGRRSEESLASTTKVRSEVRETIVGNKPRLRVEQLRAALVAKSAGRSGEPSIKTSELRIAGVDIGGHALVVELDTDLFERYDTRSKLIAAADKPAFLRDRGAPLLMSEGTRRRTDASFLIQADGTIYASVVRQIRWKGKPYPGATIDHHVVKVPNFGRIFFGEIFITAISRRLTMLRLQLGSPVGGVVAFSEVETNGSWYPP
jgi:hypothetical protein